MCDVELYRPHKPDYENYHYFAINLITQIIPEPSPESYLEKLSRRNPEIEYIGPIGHLNDAVQVRVKKSEITDLTGLKKGFASINGVESVEIQEPKRRFKKNLI